MIAVRTAYTQARKRLLLLDYDGTLAEFNADPMAATPSEELLRTLKALSDDPANTVVVISGRPGTTLEEWLGHLKLNFSAEHGFLHKKAGGSWEPSKVLNNDWKVPVRELMRLYTDRAPGTILEEKVSALTWHWRAAENTEATALLERQLMGELEKLAGPMQLRILRIIRGNKVIEVHPLGFDKGTGATYWLGQADYDFVLAAGDDTTDEDLFRVMPDESLIIKVGPGETSAPLHVENPAAMRSFLQALVT